MPAKLHLDVLRTLQSSARHGTQTLKNSNFLERFHKDLLHHLCLRFTQVAPYFIIQLFDLPSRHAENLAPLLASCRIQYTNCFSSSSNGQLPSTISLYLRVDLSPFLRQTISNILQGPHDMARCLPSILCIPRHFAAFSPQLVLPKLSSDTILSGQPNRHRARTSFDSPCIIRIV
ncbi:CFA_G0047450.mRNA.1.CDS.1 [Saccharomyces cerevisiae]|nr:CFA_G0047450.mRNA.1.CDS.1 [Saccharomyces cerevisiae]CAI7450345.1 CFA_G0047450.mRNA.1.CDS.1 [Saccharomyces cerevisiae]